MALLVAPIVSTLLCPSTRETPTGCRSCRWAPSTTTSPTLSQWRSTSTGQCYTSLSGLGSCQLVDAMEEEVQQPEDAYQDLGEEWQGANNSERFVGMMVTDGLFLLEDIQVDKLKEKWLQKDYAPDDAVFSEHGYLYFWLSIKIDVLMTENQLPCSFLRDLLQLSRVSGNSTMGAGGCSSTPSPHQIPRTPLAPTKLGWHRQASLNGIGVVGLGLDDLEVEE